MILGNTARQGAKGRTGERWNEVQRVSWRSPAARFSLSIWLCGYFWSLGAEAKRELADFGRHFTVGQNNQEYRQKYRASRSSVPSLRTTRFARALRCAHSLARSRAHFTPSRAWGKVNDWMAVYSVFFFDLAHSAFRPRGRTMV